MLAKPTLWYPGIQRNHWMGQAFVGGWLMNEGAGTGVLDVLRNANGTFASGAGSPTWIGGDVGHRLSFEGGDTIDIPAHDWGFNETNECTIILKGRINAFSGTFFEITVNGVSNTGILAFAGSPTVRWRARAGGRGVTASTISFTPSFPERGVFAFTYSTISGQFIYLDGVVKASNTANTGDFNDTIDDVGMVGALITGGFSLVGSIDYILFFNRAFTPALIRAITADPLVFLRRPKPVAAFAAAQANAGPLVNAYPLRSKLQGLVA